MEKEVKNRLFVDVHVLQTVPPSCINRDDTGSPKTAVYGGVTRARVSSQSWKHAMRQMFKETFPPEDLAYRTKRINDLLTAELIKRDFAGDAHKISLELLNSLGMKIKQNDKTGEAQRDALFFISDAQVRALADIVIVTPDLKKEINSKDFKQQALSALQQNPGIDVALFGRMVAEEPSLNTDACAQVAHAISTHRVNNEYDYFTAVDDLSGKDNSGAGHIGTVEFNSSTLYRYATIAVHELYTHLGKKTPQAVCEFIRSFVLSMPTGKQNTFANRTVPDAVLISLRNDQPINLVGAFENPVKAGDGGYVKESVRKLIEHNNNIHSSFANPSILTLGVGVNLGEQEAQNFESALEQIVMEITELSVE